jgi:hypothetical protein
MFVNITFGNNNTITEEQLTFEITQNWKQLKEEYEKGLDMMVASDYSAGSHKVSRQFRICFDKNNELNHFLSYHGVPWESLFAINSKYAFHLRKATVSSSWTITRMFDNPDYARTDHQFYNKLLPNTSIIFDGMMVEQGWFEELLKSDEFEILVLKNIEDGEDGVITELKFQSNYQVDEVHKILEGTITFIPNLFWLIKKYDFKIEAVPQNKSEKSEYANVKHQIDYHIIEGIPLPKRIEMIYYSLNNGETISHEIQELVSVKRGKIPDDIVFLRYYGFSESSDPVRMGNVVRIILMVAGVLLIIIGFYLRYRASKM